MTRKTISDAVSNIGTRHIEEAADFSVTKKVRKPVWVKWVAMAACLAVVVAVVVPLSQISQDKLPTEDIQMIEYNNSYYEVCEDKSVLQKLGIKTTIDEKDAGEVITCLTKKTSGGKSEYIATEENTNIVLYSYADAPCEVVYVIHDNGKYNAVVFCNFILPDTETISLDRLYNIKNSSDISSISVVDDWYSKKVIGSTLTNASVISKFYNASLILRDYSNDDYHEKKYGHIATEEELVQAYEETADNEITIMLETSDGLRFCLEYDAEGGWIYSNGTLRYYQVTDEITRWFSKNLK